MNSHRMISISPSKSARERHSSRIVTLADSATQLNYGSIYVFKGFAQYIGEIFTKNQQYFFYASAATNILAFLAYLYKFIVTPNKNISRIAGLVIRSISLVLVLLLTFGAAVIAAPVMMGLLAVSVLIFPVVHAIKGLYFLYKTLTAEPDEKPFFIDKMKKNFLYMGVSIVLVGVLTALFLLAPPIMLTVVAMTLGVAGAALMVVTQAWKITYAFKNPAVPTIENVEENSLPTESAIAEKNIHKSQSTVIMKSSLLKKSEEHESNFISKLKLFNFYKNIKAKPVTDVDKFICKIEKVQKKKNNPHKKEGLNFLKTFMREANSLPDSRTPQNPIEIAGKKFDYANKNELVDKIEKNLGQDYPSIFKAPLSYMGDTETLFKRGFNYFLKPKKVDATTLTSGRQFSLRV